MIIEHVETLQDRDLQPYRTLRQPEEHRKEGFFIAEGSKVVLRLLESEFEPLTMLVTPEWLEDLRPRLERYPAVRVFVGRKQLLESIVGFNLHQGVMAMAKVPVLPSLAELMPRLHPPYFLAAADGLTNSENLGVLVRNCTALGVQALIAGETSSSPYLRRAVRNSMGTIFKLPCIHSGHLPETLRALRADYGVSVYGAHPHAEGTKIADLDLRDSCCIVFGSEGEGISQPVLDACTGAAAIPMESGVDSLNVASAAAVFLYEVTRQRKRGI